MNEPTYVLARADGPHGETVLRRRGDVTELVVDGVFAMDSEQTSTEAALATLALDRLGDTRDVTAQVRVCVAGLGLGVTTAAVLADPRVTGVDVIELDAALVGWVRAGLVRGAEGLLDDFRTRVHLGDVADVLPGLPLEAFDAVLLDVDNGPGFLVHGGNERIYTREFLAAAARRVRPGGVLAVWSADPSPMLQKAVRAACGACDEVLLPVERGRRSFDYAIYLGRRPG